MSKIGASLTCPDSESPTLKLIALVLAASLALAGCSETDSASCPEGMDPFVKYELYMGRSSSDGDVVKDEEWNGFLADTVTPRFPDGLTVLEGRGQWRNSEGQILQEDATVVVILALPGDGPMGLIDEISDEYQRQFKQESVLEVVSDTCVSFS